MMLEKLLVAVAKVLDSSDEAGKYSGVIVSAEALDGLQSVFDNIDLDIP